MSDSTSNTDFVKGFRRLGVSIKDAARIEDNVEVVSTPKQFEYLQDSIETARLVSIRSGYVVSTVPFKDYVDAVANAATHASRRVGGVQVDIASRMVYDITAPDATNDITYAEWDATEKTGFIAINGAECAVFNAAASEYYDNDNPEADSDRTIFVIEFTAENPETGAPEDVTLTSYGFTNLIRRVCSYADRVL